MNKLSPVDIQNGCKNEEGCQNIGVILAESVSPDANPDTYFHIKIYYEI